MIEAWLAVYRPLDESLHCRASCVSSVFVRLLLPSRHALRTGCFVVTSIPSAPPFFLLSFTHSLGDRLGCLYSEIKLNFLLFPLRAMLMEVATGALAGHSSMPQLRFSLSLSRFATMSPGTPFKSVVTFAPLYFLCVYFFHSNWSIHQLSSVVLSFNCKCWKFFIFQRHNFSI